MNLKKRNSTDYMKPEKNTTGSKNNSLKSSDISGPIPGNGDRPKIDKESRIREAEKFNTRVDNLVRQRTKVLMESVETNAKFISILMHDLRSPFISTINVMEILMESMHNGDDIVEIEQYVNIAADSAKKTLRLIDNLLAWAVSQRKEKSFTPVKINLNELLTEEIGNVNITTKLKQITLNHSIPHGLNVTGDIQLVKTILRNLISNAIKFTDKGGKITVSAIESGKFVEVAVKDNGVGISFNAQRNLFKTGAFLSTKGTNNEKGTGIGLLLCKEFVELHGGHIRVISEPGMGCEFKFTLPHYI
jgi:signal transduction histidine kinase